MRYTGTSRLLALAMVVALVALAVGDAATAQGAPFTVNATHDAVDAAPGDGVCADVGGACTLRAAVMETNALLGADEITLPGGTYTLAILGTGEDAAATGDLDVTESLVITGDGRDSTIVDGADLDRVLEIQGSPNLALSSLTIRNGSAEAYGLGQGGGILARGTTSLSDVVIRDSHAAFGGGLYNEGTANLGNTTITGNQGDGGIYNAGTLHLADSTVTNNSGLFGGGIANRGTVSIFTSEIAQNHAAGGGGGIYSDSGIVSVTQSTVHDNVGVTAWGGILVKDGTLYIGSSQITHNSAGGNGGIVIQSSDFIVSLTTVANNVATDPSGDIGGIGIVGSTGSILSSTITGNSAPAVGGGVYVASGGTPGVAWITNTTISGNRAGRGGGVYNAFQGELTFTNVTISDNSATTSGGGIDNSASVRLHNTIVANSTGSDCSGAINSVSHNLDSDGTCGLSGPDDLSNVDPLLGPLADNGGATQTHALLAGSPAIDAGDNASCPSNDQRGGGVPRPLDGDGDGLDECDIGAFELGPTPVQCPAGQPCESWLENSQPPPTPPSLPIVLPPGGRAAPGPSTTLPLVLSAAALSLLTLGLALARRVFTHR